MYESYSLAKDKAIPYPVQTMVSTFGAFYTLLQSVMQRSMQPSPATSTTFSCQLSNTLMLAPVDSLAPPGRCPAWLNPVGWGVTLVGVRGTLPPAAETAIPLYLHRASQRSQPCLQMLPHCCYRDTGPWTHRYFMSTSSSSLPPSEA